MSTGERLYKEWMNRDDEGPERLTESIDAAIAEALERYGRHLDSCGGYCLVDGTVVGCSCGLDAARAKAEGL